MAQMVKNLPAMWETWVQSHGWEDPLEEGMATHSSILVFTNLDFNQEVPPSPQEILFCDKHLCPDSLLPLPVIGQL